MRPLQINLIEIPLRSRTKNTNLKNLIQEEGKQILAKTPPDSLVVALDEHGKQWNNTELAKNFQHWQTIYKNLTIIIGGPDGLSKDVLKKAHYTWSLSPLTFPHQLVRIILIEQLHRTWSILNNHPYHKAHVIN